MAEVGQVGDDARGTVAALLVVLISFAGGVVTWRADHAGGMAATHDRQGIVEALHYQGEAEQAEIEARTEQRTFVAYVSARLRQDAAAALRDDPVARVDAVAQRRVGERLERGFPEEFVRRPVSGGVEHASFDVAGRTAALLRERRVRDGSARLFALAEEEKDARQALLLGDLVLVLGLAAATLGQLTGKRAVVTAATGAGVLSLGYAAALLVVMGFR